MIDTNIELCILYILYIYNMIHVFSNTIITPLNSSLISFVLQAASGEWVLAAADSQSVGSGRFVGIGKRGRIGCRGGRRRGRCTQQQYHVRIPGTQSASFIWGEYTRGGELVLYTGTNKKLTLWHHIIAYCYCSSILTAIVTHYPAIWTLMVVLLEVISPCSWCRKSCWL